MANAGKIYHTWILWVLESLDRLQSGPMPRTEGHALAPWQAKDVLWFMI